MVIIKREEVTENINADNSATSTRVAFNYYLFYRQYPRQKALLLVLLILKKQPIIISNFRSHTYVMMLSFTFTNDTP